MSLAGNRASLVSLTKELLLTWQETREKWQDSKSVEFERKYLEDLRVNLDKTIDVIEQLDKLLLKIRNDCE